MKYISLAVAISLKKYHFVQMNLEIVLQYVIFETSNGGLEILRYSEVQDCLRDSNYACNLHPFFHVNYSLFLFTCLHILWILLKTDYNIFNQ